MKNKILYMAMMMALAFTACSEEDIMQSTNGEAGTLRITSVSIEGQEAGRSRVAYEGSTTQEYLYNRSITGLSDGDKLTLNYTFNTVKKTAYAIMNGCEWALTSDVAGNTPVTINPIKNGGGIWNNVYMDASFGGGEITGSDEGYSTIASRLGIVQGNSSVIPTGQIKLLADALYADTNTDGGITINKDLNSPTLGTTTIALKHNRALLRVPSSSVSIDNNSSYIVNGSVCQVSGLATLWAVVEDVVEDNKETFYYPFTKVSIESTDYLQVIVPVGSLTGFKAVLSSNTSTVTIDLPFKVDNAVSTNLTLAPNTRYPLTLNISPNEAEVSFSSAASKPGWGNEDPLSNDMNDLVIYAETELSYNVENNTFSVSGPSGLQLLNRWMAKSITTAVFKSVNFVGYDNLADNEDPLSVNVLLTQDIRLPDVPEGESNWIPIGDGSSHYLGTFDGNNKTIRNLTIVDGSIRYIGLIGCLSSTGKVKDVNLENVLIDSRSRVSNPINYVGGIVGQSYADTDEEAEVSGCTVSGKIWGGGFSCVGGIVGCTENGNFIRDCTLVAGSELDAKDPVGGIVGAMGTNCKVYNCNVSSDIKIGSYKSETAGGIVGRAGNGTLIEKCETAEGSEVKGNMRVAGILADSNSSSTNTCKVIDCINRSNVRLDMETSYEEYIGGIVADGNNIDITNCTNYGALTSDDAVYMGGIIGKGPSCKLENCTNMETATLTVTSKTPDQFTRLGGIIGYADFLVQVKGCMNHAAITHTYNRSQNYIGGIVGVMDNYNNGDGFVACGNTGIITLQNMDGITNSSLYVGGIAGTNYDTDCKYRGCWTRDVVEHYLTADQTTEKDGFGYVSSASSIINSYTASAKTEGTDQAFINGKTGYTDDETSDEGMSMNKALETLFYASGKPGASLSTKYYWQANTNGGWPTLTTTAPTMPTGN